MRCCRSCGREPPWKGRGPRLPQRHVQRRPQGDDGGRVGSAAQALRGLSGVQAADPGTQTQAGGRVPRSPAPPTRQAPKSLDERPARLQALISEGLIDSVVRQLESGKEADVYVVRCGDQTRAAKVYKEAHKRRPREHRLHQGLLIGRPVLCPALGRLAQPNTTTWRMALPSCRRSKPWLISSSVKRPVSNRSTGRRPCEYRSM